MTEPVLSEVLAPEDAAAWAAWAEANRERRCDTCRRWVDVEDLVGGECQRCWNGENHG